jgi:hypothetical protein
MAREDTNLKVEHGVVERNKRFVALTMVKNRFFLSFILLVTELCYPIFQNLVIPFGSGCLTSISAKKTSRRKLSASREVGLQFPSILGLRRSRKNMSSV